MPAIRNAANAPHPTMASNAADVAKDVLESVKSRAKSAVFSRHGDKFQVNLFGARIHNGNAPVFYGVIDGDQVAAFLCHSSDDGHPFLRFVNSANVQVGTATVVIRKDGVPTVRAMMGLVGEAQVEAWFNVSKNVTNDTLDKLGADMSKLHVNKKNPYRTESFKRLRCL